MTIQHHTSNISKIVCTFILPRTMTYNIRTAVPLTIIVEWNSTKLDMLEISIIWFPLLSYSIDYAAITNNTCNLIYLYNANCDLMNITTALSDKSTDKYQ